MTTPRRYYRASGLFFNTPLALLPAKCEEILGFWDAKFAGIDLDFSGRQEPLAATEAETHQGGKIAILPLHGVISQRANMLTDMSGGTSTELFGTKLRELVRDPDIKSIIIDIDSPGGSVYGLTELSDVIYNARGEKPMIGVVNSLGASAAYWIASQFDEIVVTPGGELGHIGVVALHLDRSKQAENEGVTPTMVTAGKYKSEQTMGSDLFPLSDEALRHMQESVDETYERFVSAVARGRNTTVANVKSGFGEGRLVAAKEAIKLNMADKIATLEQTINRFAGAGRVSRRRPQDAVFNVEAADVEDPATLATLAAPQNLTHGDHGDLVLAVNVAYLARTAALIEMRATDGRKISQDKRALVLDIIEKNKAVIQQVESVLSRPETEIEKPGEETPATDAPPDEGTPPTDPTPPAEETESEARRASLARLRWGALQEQAAMFAPATVKETA